MKNLCFITEPLNPETERGNQVGGRAPLWGEAFFKKAGPLLCPNPTANPVSVIREDVKL